MAIKTEVLHPNVPEECQTSGCSTGISDGWRYVSAPAAVDYPNGVFAPGINKKKTYPYCTMHNGPCILDVAGCSFDDVKSTGHFAGLTDLAARNAVYATYFPHAKPARTTSQLALGNGPKIGIDVVAKLAQS